MPSFQVNMIKQMNPKKLDASHFLSKAAIKAASSFNLGDKTISLDINPKIPPSAIVNEFKLSTLAAKTLGRKVNFVESVASTIATGSDTINEIKTYLVKVKTPADIVDNSQFYFITVRRRDATSALIPSDLLSLKKQFHSAKEQNFLLGLYYDSKKQKLIATIIHQSYKLAGRIKKGGATIVTIPTDDNDSDDAQKPPSTTTTAQPDPDNTQDFAECYQKCMDKIPPFLLALAGSVCTACAATLVAAPVSAPAIAIACSGCAVAIGIILGNCLLTCHEML